MENKKDIEKVIEECTDRIVEAIYDVYGRCIGLQTMRADALEDVLNKKLSDKE